jgi:hypothetical protein
VNVSYQFAVVADGTAPRFAIMHQFDKGPYLSKAEHSFLRQSGIQNKNRCRRLSA